MVTQLNPTDTPSVIVMDGVVHITDFVESDPEVVTALDGTDDPDTATHTLLRIGAQAVRIASADLDTDLVERRFEAMTGAFDTTVVNAVAAIAGTADELLDEEHGALPAVMGEARTKFEQLLGDAFDPDSKSSAIAKIEEVLGATSEQLVRSIRATFSLDQPDSPLSRTKREMVEVVKEESKSVLAEVREIATALATNTAVAEVADKLTTKGVTFEDLIAGSLEPFANAHGDIVEPVGRTVGVTGTKKGDVLVTIAADDTGGRPVRFVLEAKDQKLSMTKTLAEIDAALANHDAAAAIAVFAGENLAPVRTPFWYAGNRAILVFDKADPDPKALRLAYEWARWIGRRSVQEVHAATLDVAEIQAAIDRGRRAVKRHQAIKACHSVIKTKADEARNHVADLVDDVDQAMADLLEAISRVDEAA